jgi:L-ascorbate metabolism protein UlaG (beta-lactamase superfamily)
VEITWLGHSCFKVKGKEVVLVTDPCGSSIGYSPDEVEAQIVTLSHQHPGHSGLEIIEGSPKVLNGPGEYEVSEVFVTGIVTFHDTEEGSSRGKNTAYIIEMDEMKLCHLGDLGHLPSPQQAEDFSNVEVLFIPVGGVSTVDAKMAAEIVRRLSPRLVIPMHYQTDIVDWLEPVDKFINEMGFKEIIPQSKISFTRSNLPVETQIQILDYQ